MKKKKRIIFGFIALVLLVLGFLFAYRPKETGGRVIKVNAKEERGFYSEYYLFIPDTLKKSDAIFLLAEPNNTGFVDDNHRKHRDAAYDIVRFGQANAIARQLCLPLLVPCFDRPETNWETYTHALDRDTLLIEDGALRRIDMQLLAMIEDARDVLAKKDIRIEDKVFLNGFSASGSFVNRFTALHPDKVAAVAAGGVNSMVILPVGQRKGRDLIYPVGVADLEEIAGVPFQFEAFASVPQYYYMGQEDENDALSYDDAYSDLEREIVKSVLGEDMALRFENCRDIYESQGISAVFRTFPGVGHETTGEMNEVIVSFFRGVMDEYR